MLFLKWYYVFNVEQTRGLEEHFYETPPPKPAEDSLAAVAKFIRTIDAEVRHGGDDAYYKTHGDFIMLPSPDHFKDARHYYATSLHEHAHWSGHPSRLDRDLSGRFGTRAYAAEELIAELAAAFLCATLEIPGELRHAGYIQSWLELLRDDRKAIFTAASAASKAADYLRMRGEHGEWLTEYEGAQGDTSQSVSHRGGYSE
jgi:antirestriction protein ArdC